MDGCSHESEPSLLQIVSFAPDQPCAGAYLASCVWLESLFEESSVGNHFVPPGRSWENGCMESFNGKLRDELLKRESCDTLLEAKVLIE